MVIAIDAISPLRPGRTSFRRRSVVTGNKDGETIKQMDFIHWREKMNFRSQSI